MPQRLMRVFVPGFVSDLSSGSLTSASNPHPFVCLGILSGLVLLVKLGCWVSLGNGCWCVLMLSPPNLCAPSQPRCLCAREQQYEDGLRQWARGLAIFAGEVEWWWARRAWLGGAWPRLLACWSCHSGVVPTVLYQQPITVCAQWIAWFRWQC